MTQASEQIAKQFTSATLVKRIWGSLGYVATVFSSLQVAIDTAARDGVPLFIPNGDYDLTSPLIQPSNSWVYAQDNARINRKFSGLGTANATIKNSDTVNGNTNIVWSGGILTATSAYEGKHFGYWNVNGLRIENNKIRGCYGDWMSIFRNTRNVFINGIDWDAIGNGLFTDGLHFCGGHDIVVSDAIIASGDDCLSFTIETDFDIEMYKININNVVCTTRRASVIKMKVNNTLDPTAKIRDITITNVTGTAGTVGAGTAMIIQDSTGAKRIEEITLENINLDASNGAGSGAIIDQVKGLYMTKVRMKNPEGTGFVLTNISKLCMKRVDVDSPRAQSGNGLSMQNVDNFDIDNPTLIFTAGGAASNGIIAGSGANAATNGRILNATISGHGNEGISMQNGNTVTVRDSRISGNKGIIEYSGSDFNTIESNDIRNCTGTKISNNGANSRVRGNFGFVTEKRGTNGINPSQTFIDVPHGLSGTPSSAGITVRPINTSAEPWPASETHNPFIIDYANVGPTTFRVYRVGAANASKLPFSWEACLPRNI